MKLRHGTIVEMKPETGRARVRFDEDGIVSAFLPICYQKTTGDKFTYSLDPGQYVACMMDEHSENGVIVGAIYAGDNAPAGAGADIWAVEFSDGARIEYNRAAKLLTVTTTGEVQVNCDVANITADSGVNIVADVNIDGNLEVSGGIDAGDGINVTGSVDASGEITSTAGGVPIALTGHIHPTPAGPSSPPIVAP